MTKVLLSEPTKAAIRELLIAVYPAWKDRPPRDQRVVFDRMTDRAGYSMFTQPYAGTQSNAYFLDTAGKTEPVTKFNAAKDLFDPPLMGYLTTPLGTWRASDVTPLLLTWCEYLDKLTRAQPFQEALERLITDLEALFSGEASIVTTTVVRGLKLPDEIDDVPLAENHPVLGTVTLHRVSHEEFRDWFSKDVYQERHSIMDMIALSAAITHRRPLTMSAQVDAPASSAPNVASREAREAGEHVLRALHVAKPGRVQVSTSTMGFEPRVMPAWGGMTLPGPVSQFGEMSFAAKDLDHLRRVLSALLDCRQEVVVAANRLIDAEGRTNLADTVIDTTIGLETLLLKTSQELTFRVKLNYAFLGRPDEWKARSTALDDLYSTRGKIVHGSSQPNNEKWQGKVYKAAGEGKIALRDALHRFLRDPILRKGTKLDDEFWLNRIVSPPAVILSDTME